MKKIFFLLLISIFPIFYAQVNDFELITTWADGNTMNDSNLDGIIYIKNNGKYYKRKNSETFNVKWFGAKADGVSDDTKSIQKAIDLLSKINKPYNVTGGWLFGGGKIFLPSGKYKISKILLRDNISLIGEDKNSTLISSSESIAITNIVGSNNGNLKMSQSIAVKNLFIVGSGIELVGAYDSSVENVKIFNSGVAINLGLTVKLDIDNVQIFNCQNGIVVNDSFGSGANTSLTIRNSWIAHCSGTGILLKGNINKLITTSIKDNVLEYNNIGIDADGKMQNVVIENIHFEGNKSNNIRIGQNSSLYLRNIWADSSNILVNGNDDKNVYFENIFSDISINESFIGTISLNGFNKIIQNPNKTVKYKIIKD